jgi:uncharacterized membrane protein
MRSATWQDRTGLRVIRGGVLAAHNHAVCDDIQAELAQSRVHNALVRAVSDLKAIL